MTNTTAALSSLTIEHAHISDAQSITLDSRDQTNLLSKLSAALKLPTRSQSTTSRNSENLEAAPGANNRTSALEIQAGDANTITPSRFTGRGMPACIENNIGCFICSCLVIGFATLMTGFTFLGKTDSASEDQDKSDLVAGAVLAVGGMTTMIAPFFALCPIQNRGYESES